MNGSTTPVDANAEPIWPGVTALVAAAAINWLLPASLAAGPGWFGVLLVLVLAALSFLLPKWHRILGHMVSATVTAQMLLALTRLIGDLITHSGKPVALLQGALLLWSMNILVFASWYWRLDAGGPHHRSKRQSYSGGAFLFPQLTLGPELRAAMSQQHWRPSFVDYLFLAFNTSTAFSPTDVPVLSAWAKVLMMVQASISLLTLATVAARAVNIL